jgi:tetratricopeptide (TPR) repeat protein
MLRVLGKCRVRLGLVALPLILLAGCGSPEQRSQDYFEKGMALLAKNDDLNARVALTTSLKFNSNRIEAWRALAGIDERTKANSSLFQDLRRIVELDPKDTNTRLRLARIMTDNNGNDAALKLLDGATDEDKTRPDYHALRATILLKTNDPQGAVREAKQAISIEPGNLEATIVLASDQVARGDVDGALQRLDALPAGSKDDIRVTALKVLLYEKKKDLPQTEAMLKKLVGSRPQFRSQLIQLYLEQRRLDDAERELRAVVSANPADSRAALDVVRFLASFRGASAAKDELLTKIKAGGDVFPYQMTLVDLDFLRGDYEEAVGLLNGIIKEDSSSEHILAAKDKLAQIAISRNEIPAAQQIIAEVLAKDARDAGALKLRATIRLGNGQVDNAIADLREALNTEPKSSELLLLMAAAYERSGKVELAERQYADAARFSDFSPPVALRYVAFLQSKGNLALAEDVSLEIARRNPRNIQVLSTVAQLKLARKDWTGAFAIADAVRAAGDNLGVADQIKAAALAGQNKPDASIAALEAAHTAAPDAVQPVLSLVAAYMRAGTPDKAEGLLRDMLKKYPSNAELLVLLGQTQAATGKSDEAKNSFKAAIAQQPKNEAGYDALLNYYVVQKNYGEANGVVQAGLKERPDSINLRLAAASLLISAGKEDAAIAAYEAILKDQPNSLIVLNNLVSLLLDNRSDKESLERAATLAESLKKSEVPQYQDTFGWAQYKRGNGADAVRILEPVASKLPKLPAVRYHLGMAYLAAGQSAQAAEQFKVALNLEPDGTTLKEKIRAAMK